MLSWLASTLSKAVFVLAFSSLRAVTAVESLTFKLLSWVVKLASSLWQSPNWFVRSFTLLSWLLPFNVLISASRESWRSLRDETSPTSLVSWPEILVLSPVQWSNLSFRSFFSSSHVFSLLLESYSFQIDKLHFFLSSLISSFAAVISFKEYFNAFSSTASFECSFKYKFNSA